MINEQAGVMTPRNLASFAMALAILALALSIAYFAYVLSRFENEIPQILQSVQQTSEKIEPVMTEVANIREVIPPIVEEVAEIRKQIPSIVEEVRLTREQIPLVLAEVEAIRKELPQVEKIIDKSSNTVVLVVKETEAIRKLTPDILAEVKATREMVPPTLDRVDQSLNKADHMIAKAREAGKEATTGAVTGFFKGVVTAPFVFVGNVGQSVFGMSSKEVKDYTDKDLEMLTTASNEVLAMPEIGAYREWKNEESGHHGKTTLKSIEASDGTDCRVLHVQAWKNGKEKYSKNIRLCKNVEGKWEKVSEE